MDPVALFPPTTAHYGSIMDGPHIDAKSVRRVGNDERLWFAVSAVNFPLVTQSEIVVNQDVQIRGYLDFRVLGRLTRAHNRSNF